MVEIYTDGAAKGNPGPGGYAVILRKGTHEKVLTKGFRLTTNNRMELMAVIAGLEALKKPGIDVVIYSDSKYVVDAVEKRWVFEWAKNNFRKKKNADLWRRFLDLYDKYHIQLRWIRGHNQHPLNERCDKLAVSAAETDAVAIDEAYEKSLQ